MELYFLFLLILIMAVALGSGYPVAFALPGAAIITIGLAAGAGYFFAGSTDAYFHSGGPQQWLSAGVTNLRGVYWEVERDTLIAIPLFIFMGIMLQRSKIAEDLLVTMAQLFGPVPGGLGISVVFVGALLAATTGIVGATVVAMGLISLPAMLRNKYSPSLATGTIAASGTLGQIIPPSIVLIILADQLASAADQASTLRKALHKSSTGELSMPSVFDVGSTSAGEMFLGAFVPGIVLVLLYMIYILVFAILRPKSAPAVHYDGKYDGRFWVGVFFTLVPPLALIFLVLGSIIAGIATVNQAGAIGAAGALIMAGYRLPKHGRLTYVPALLAIVSMALIAFALNRFEMNVKAIDTPADVLGIQIGAFAAFLLLVSLLWSGWRVLKLKGTLQGVMLETAKTTSLVFIILLGAAMLTAAFRAFGGEDLVRNFLNGLPGGFWTQFIIVMAVIFILGFFLDFIEIAVVVVPIVAPILLSDPSANITAVWLGVMIVLNIQTSFLTPPFGFALFYLRGVAPPSVKTVQMYKGVIAFIMLQLLALGIVGRFPELVNYLPNRVSFLGETAPPPRNPKLQICLEDYVTERLAKDGSTLSALDRARALDLTVLPKDLRKTLEGSVANADKALVQLAAAGEAERAVTDGAVAYRPMLTEVRQIEKDIRRLQARVDVLTTRISRMGADADPAEKIRLEARVTGLNADIAKLETGIPGDWTALHDSFAKLVKAEDSARNQYRRAADDAYEAVAELVAVLDGTAGFDALGAQLRDLRAVIETQPEAEAEAPVYDLARAFGDIEGADAIKSALNAARRALKDKQPDRAAALAEYETALAEYDAQKVWRTAVEEAMGSDLRAYRDGLRGTLGIRLQQRLTREQALFMAACTASHRDVSLSF
jgi:TRAP-type mannitol/chloroaromatic compound transport system permease large subunit/ubiquinone biosynthesis protein UbiJ